MVGLLVHEWFERVGGAEAVVNRWLDLFPDAPLLCTWNDVPDHSAADRIRETWIARTPLRGRKALALPASALAFRRQRIDADWMLVSSYGFAHHVSLRRSDVPKLVYAHTPARYMWHPEQDHRGDSFAIRTASTVLRPYDRHRAQEATSIAANSRYIADRIATDWGREAEVIHPAVDVTAIQKVADWSATLDDADAAELDRLPQDFLLGFSRWVGYKRLDRVIEIGNLVGAPVVIAGSGPEDERLTALAAAARVPVVLLRRPSDALIRALFQRCRAFVYPPIEDFGIVPVEAQAAGAFVVGHAVGGSLETIGPAGRVVDIDDDAAVRAALEAGPAASADEAAVWARRFDTAHFDTAIRAWVERSTH